MARAEGKRLKRGAGPVVPLCILASLPQSFARKAVHALEDALEIRGVQFRLAERRGQQSFYFYSLPLIEAEVKRQNRPLLALSADRWLHVAIDLNRVDERWRINHISVGLLQGEPTGTKTMLLRAEWQMFEQKDTSGHGQPHWHVMNPIDAGDEPRFDEIVEASTGFTAFLEATETGASATVELENSTDSFSHFHYAMSAGWHHHPAAGHSHVLQDENAAVSWLGYCVKYIGQQLRHVDRKAGSVA